MPVEHAHAVSMRAVSATNANPSAMTTMNHVHSKDIKTFVLDLLLASFTSGLMFLVTKMTLNNFDQTRRNSTKGDADIKRIIERLKQSKQERMKERGMMMMETKDTDVVTTSSSAPWYWPWSLTKSSDTPIVLNAHESTIVGEVTLPEEIHVRFDDIGGLEELKSQLIETVLLPLSSPHLFSRQDVNGQWRSRKLVAPPKGVLFYGPPGTGKTMTAKAIAKDSGATFINLRWSTLKNQWYGESQKLIRAVFSLAHKLAPTIVFVDEAECFLGQRGGIHSHEETNSLKAEFMSLWDGLKSDCNVSQCGHVVVLCATNRPFDLDEAILRRMPRTFEFSLPHTSERLAILNVILKDEELDDDVSMDVLVDLTREYSGSDLTELCRYAAMIPVREIMRQSRELKEPNNERINEHPRRINTSDFAIALEHVKPSGSTSKAYQVKRFVKLTGAK